MARFPSSGCGWDYTSPRGSATSVRCGEVGRRVRASQGAEATEKTRELWLALSFLTPRNWRCDRNCYAGSQEFLEGKIKIGTPLHSNLFLFLVCQSWDASVISFFLVADASYIRTNLLSFFLCARADVIFPWPLTDNSYAHTQEKLKISKRPVWAGAYAQELS